MQAYRDLRERERDSNVRSMSAHLLRDVFASAQGCLDAGMSPEQVMEILRMAIEDEEEPDRFCTQCGVVTSFDEDGCCASCGCDTCSMSTLRDHLLRADRCPLCGGPDGCDDGDDGDAAS